MNTFELKQGKLLRQDNVFKNVVLPGLGEQHLELQKISHFFFTDGLIDYLSEEKTMKINHFCIDSVLGKKIYEFNVDTLKERSVSFKDYSFILSFYIVERALRNGRLCGLFPQIDGERIYLENQKDIESRKKSRIAFQNVYDLFETEKDLTVVRSTTPIVSPDKVKIKQLERNIYQM